MPDPLAEVWTRADAQEARFSADEVSSWPEDHEALLTEAKIIRRDDNTTTVICDACHEGHVEEVTLIESPAGAPVRAYIHCAEAGRVAVSLERLKQWVVDFDGLAWAVANGLDLAGTVEEVAPARIWFLGKATVAGRSREVFLARGLTWTDAPDVVGTCVQLNAARAAVIFVPGNLPPEEIWNGDPPPVVPLKIVTSLEGTTLSIDRNHLEGLLSKGSRKAPIKAQKSFPTPPGTQWHEVMIWVADTQISIEAKRRRREFTFQLAGFEEKRKGGVPDAIWGLLKVFGMRGGVIPYNGEGLDLNTRNNIKQYVTVLRKRLHALIPGVDGDPVPYDKEERCYRMAFKIAGQDNLTFPTPEGTEWPNVTITLTRSAAIRISVSTTERYATSNYVEEPGSDIHQWEAAQRESELEREYNLRMVGLSDEEGRLDRRGAALLEVLQGKGVVRRPADDEAMLDLCGFLTKLMDINGSPFDFAPYEEKWVALFETSSEIASGR